MTDWTFKIINTNQRKNSTQTENCRLYQSSLRRVQKERKKKINKEIGGGGGGKNDRIPSVEFRMINIYLLRLLNSIMKELGSLVLTEFLNVYCFGLLLLVFAQRAGMSRTILASQIPNKKLIKK